jgi:hypothetical protein
VGAERFEARLHGEVAANLTHIRAHLANARPDIAELSAHPAQKLYINL